MTGIDDEEIEIEFTNFRCDGCGAYVYQSPIWTCECHGWNLCEDCTHTSEHKQIDEKMLQELGYKEVNGVWTLDRE